MSSRARTFRAARLTAVAACLSLGACGARTASLTVEVRDAATHQPASGVTVVADVPSNFHPFSVASILGQTGPESSRAVTDIHGLAHLTYVPDRPIRILVFAADAPAVWTIVDEPMTGKDWMQPPALVVVPGGSGEVESSNLVLRVRGE